MRPVKIIAVIISFCLSLLLNAQEEKNQVKRVEWRGYIKDLQTASFVNSADSLTSLHLLHNRINFKFGLSEKFSGRVEIRNRIFYGDQLKLVNDITHTIARYDGLFDLSKLWVNEKTLVVHSLIDRILLQYSTDKWDIKAGRQRINWGIHTIWNPNDIFNAYNFLDFDYEERPGTDAIRIQHYGKNNTSVELAYKPGKRNAETIAAVLYKFNKKNYDIQLLGGVYQQDILIGTGWAGSLEKAGYKGELSYFHPRKNWTDSSGSFCFSLMADQTFKKDWYISIAALFTSNPAAAGFSNGTILTSDLSAKQLFPYRYAFYTGLLKVFSPACSMNISLIYSPEKNSLILFPSWSWNLAKDFDLDFTAQSFFAKEARRYKTGGTTLFLRGKWSF
jgi:hypothetical protein